MKRLFAILVLGFLALGIAGLSAGGAAAGPANCAPDTASILDDVEAMANPAAYAEQASPRLRANLSDTRQYACNSACAPACAAAAADREAPRSPPAKRALASIRTRKNP